MPWPDAPTLAFVGQLAFILGVALAFASVPSVLRTRRGSPLSALSWLFALMLFPWAGTILWWFFGRNALRRRRTKRAEKRAEFLERRGQPSKIQVPFAEHEKNKLEASAAAEIQDCGYTPVQVLCEGEQAFAQKLDAIAQAKIQINIIYYIWSNDETGLRLRDQLCERARAGVSVHVLLDAIGSLDLGRNFWDPLTQAGGKVSYFMKPRLWTKGRPSWNFRNHRKILVVDHSVAFTGGMNIANHYAKDWKDVHMKCHGSAARALEQIFFDDWYYATGEYISAPSEIPEADSKPMIPADVTVLSSGPDSPQPWIHDRYFRAMAGAKQRIWLATPYFVPTESISTALRTAALRGVDVRLLVPGKNDRKLVQWAAGAYYPGLIAAGVKVFEYQPSMMHAKVWVIDQELSSIGSANLDTRSFRLNFEVTCLIKSARVAQTLEQWFEKMLSHSTRLSLESVKKAPSWKIWRDALAHLWSPLL